jgi:hypothetical protein
LPPVHAIPLTTGTGTASAPSPSAAPERESHRRWPLALAAAGLALIVGIGVGYMMVPGSDSKAGRAKIESSQDGGTRLRFDYDLQHR